MDKTYKIKPLEWTVYGSGSIEAYYRDVCYTIYQDKDSTSLYKYMIESEISFDLSDSYYPLEKCKEMCNEYHIKDLKKYLIEN